MRNGFWSLGLFLLIVFCASLTFAEQRQMSVPIGGDDKHKMVHNSIKNYIDSEEFIETLKENNKSNNRLNSLATRGNLGFNQRVSSDISDSSNGRSWVAENEVAGKWKRGNFTHANVICSQQWSCDTPPVLIDPLKYKSVITPDETTKGVCSADGGTIDACNSCVASEPKTRCEVSVVPK